MKRNWQPWAIFALALLLAWLAFNQHRQAQWLNAIGMRVHLGPPPYSASPN